MTELSAQKGEIRASFQAALTVGLTEGTGRVKQGTAEKALLKSGKSDNDSWDQGGGYGN